MAMLVYQRVPPQEWHLSELRPGSWRRSAGARVPQRLGGKFRGSAQRRVGLEYQGVAGGVCQAG